MGGFRGRSGLTCDGMCLCRAAPGIPVGGAFTPLPQHGCTRTFVEEMKTKILFLTALACLALTGCSTYRGGTDDTYTYSRDSLYGLGPAGPQVYRPDATIPFTLAQPPLPPSPYRP